MLLEFLNVYIYVVRWSGGCFSEFYRRANYDASLSLA